MQRRWLVLSKTPKHARRVNRGKTMPKKKIGKCVYCLEDGIVTREHVVPRSFFPEIPAGNLPIVSVCGPCNQGKSKNDSYLRDILATDIGAAGSAEVKDLLGGRISRSVKGKHSKLSREAIICGTNEAQYSEGGIYLGDAYVVPVDQQSVEKSLSLMTRGIFHFFTRSYLPADQTFLVRKLRGNEFQELWSKFGTNCPDNSFGWGGTVSGRFCYQENPLIVWLVLVFYQGVPVSILSAPNGYDFGTLQPTK